MPAGCEFICENEKCDYYKTGFSITAPWPMANINIVINSLANREHKEFKKELIELKNKGKELAIITCPNIYNVVPTHYRIQMWSNKAKCIWEYSIPYKEEYSEEEIYKDIPTICPTSGDTLIKFNDIIESGIVCPKCGEKLFQSRWYSNFI